MEQKEHITDSSKVMAQEGMPLITNEVIASLIDLDKERSYPYGNGSWVHIVDINPALESQRDADWQRHLVLMIEERKRIADWLFRWQNATVLEHESYSDCMRRLNNDMELFIKELWEGK